MLDEKDLQAIAELMNQSIRKSENWMKAYIESNVEKQI